MKINHKIYKLIIILLLLIESGVIFLMYKSLSSRKDNQIDGYTTNNVEIKNDVFALLVEQEDGTYVEYSNNVWPTEGYIFNSKLSGCIDKSGNKLENALMYYENTNKVTVDTTTTTSCYLYFDIYNAPPVIKTFYLGGNSNQIYTTTNNINAYISWDDDDISHYCIINAMNSSDCEWISIENSNSVLTNHTLTNTDKEHYLYAFIKDENGNISDFYSDSIVLDRTSPLITYSLSGGSYNNEQELIITMTDTNGIEHAEVEIIPNKCKYATTPVGALCQDIKESHSLLGTSNTLEYKITLDGPADYIIKTKVYDNAGNKNTQEPNDDDGWYYQEYTISNYEDVWVDGLSGSYEISPISSFAGDFKPKVKVEWSESYNLARNASIVKIEGLYFKMSDGYRLRHMYFGGPLDSGDRGVYINNYQVQSMDFYKGTHKAPNSQAGVYILIEPVNYPWESEEITHNPDGTLSIPIRVYFRASEKGEAIVRAQFDNTTYITLTDTRS